MPVLATTAPATMSTPPIPTDRPTDSPRKATASSAAASGSVEEMIAVRTAPSRCSPANRQTNAAAVDRDERAPRRHEHRREEKRAAGEPDREDRGHGQPGIGRDTAEDHDDA